MDHASHPVPLLDVKRQYEPLREQLLAAVTQVCDSGRYILGPECEQLERAVAAYTGARHAIACASGSDALLLALMALNIGEGDEVICPSYTFFATASAVWRLGAEPVFCDIEPATFNIDPAKIAPLISPQTKAIIPVHLFGQCAAMDEIGRVAAKHSLPIIEDACQAIGAAYAGRSAGTLGDMGCFSFYPTKNLGGMGDGGLLTTDHDELAAKLRLLRGHGMEPRYHHHVVGINSRLDTLQAAVLNVKLPHLDHWARQRQTNADRYHMLFAEYGLDKIIALPHTARAAKHVWNQYTIRVPDGRRNELRQHLTAAKIGTEIYYPVPLHEQKCFTSLGYPLGSLSETELAARETLALPIFPELTAPEQQIVVASIANFFGAARKSSPAAPPNAASAESRSAPAGAKQIPRPKFLQPKSTEVKR
ncbi:MAG TPA: DegT/DnrJ/EryC1/StrS family aminotransferase [Pirellulales bacterium]|jgi:dTDP-4-amino-4,6-dideoxygalactose transaminase|nr:DegT/DnrJ/EryC1/StrS family aminotransferase [Pirellulales bacterium]